MALAQYPLMLDWPKALRNIVKSEIRLKPDPDFNYLQLKLEAIDEQRPKTENQKPKTALQIIKEREATGTLPHGRVSARKIKKTGRGPVLMCLMFWLMVRVGRDLVGRVFVDRCRGLNG